MTGSGELATFRNTHRQRRAVLWVLQTLTVMALSLFLLLPPVTFTVITVVCLLLMGAQCYVCRSLARQSELALKEREELLHESQLAHQQIEILFAMTDLLQSADSTKEAGMVLENTTHRLLPHYAGALYMFNKAADRLELSKKWGRIAGREPVDALAAHRCWALKRGKLHVNDRSTGALLCKHYVDDLPTIEVPMVARGSLHGLLILTPAADAAEYNIERNTRIAQAMSDSLSLALSNIELRETLRVQSLHDPLTGLYNRRYMEEALEQTLAAARRPRTPTSVIMVDLDNFKQLNDQHGHAMGDIILRDVAQTIVAALRPADIVSRYGGEELLVILPDCTLSSALVRAEMLRKRVEGLAALHDVTITASLGVATAPDMGATTAEIIERADSALYVAKRNGRNRVEAATAIPFSGKHFPVEKLLA